MERMEGVDAGYLYMETPTMHMHVHAVMILGAYVSGIDVSVDPRGWQRNRACSIALDEFPTVNGTGVSARGRPI